MSANNYAICTIRIQIPQALLNLDTSAMLGVLYIRMKKHNVAILGATGTVGQKLIRLLDGHPWFRVHELVASPRSAGKRYETAVKWREPAVLNSAVAQRVVQRLDEPLESAILFSGLDSAVAGEAESRYAAAGHTVISNAKNHRLDDNVPLVIPEINCDHFAVTTQQQSAGKIITNSNCSTMALALALAPLHRAFTVQAVHVTTLQAVSGAGYPGVAALDILGNIIPYINGEEEKIEVEPRKILGTYRENKIEFAPFKVSAHCTRVPVVDGHTLLVSVQLQSPPRHEDMLHALQTFQGEAQRLRLPSAPQHPIYVTRAEDRPQVLRDVHRARGMAITVGRVRSCPINDVKFVVLGHNTVRGAAGAAILNGEAYCTLGYTV